LTFEIRTKIYDIIAHFLQLPARMNPLKSSMVLT